MYLGYFLQESLCAVFIPQTEKREMTLVLNELSQGFIAHQLKSLAELFSSVVFVIRVNLFPSLDIFVPLWFMFTSLFSFYPSKLLF